MLSSTTKLPFCMLIKMLNPSKANVIIRITGCREINLPIIRYLVRFVPLPKVDCAIKDKVGREGASIRADAFDSCDQFTLLSACIASLCSLLIAGDDLLRLALTTLEAGFIEVIDVIRWNISHSNLETVEPRRLEANISGIKALFIDWLLFNEL